MEQTAARLGVDPFEILCLFAKGDAKGLKLIDKIVPAEMRLHAAKEACKYLYSQRRAVQLANADGQGFKITVEDYTSKKP